MLQLVKTMKSLDFPQLVGVYSGSFDPHDHKRTQVLYEYLIDFFKCYGGLYALWIEGECYCSALRFEPYRDGYLISGLETAPGKRGKGYAKSLMKSVLEYASKNGIERIYSHIANNNRVSIRLHKSCGFNKIQDYAVYIDGSVYRNSGTFCYEL